MVYEEETYSEPEQVESQYVLEEESIEQKKKKEEERKQQQQPQNKRKNKIFEYLNKDAKRNKQ